MEQTPSIPPEYPGATGESQVVLPPEPSHKLRSALSTIAILIAAPLAALLLITFVFQSYEVDGPSMETSLQNRDRLIVWKVPRTLAKITGNSYIPKFGEIIVFRKSGLGNENDKQLIKRVLALPGDRVVVKDGRITVYNDKHPQGYNPDANNEFSGDIATLTTGNIDITVPADQLFVCGDNRTNSLDSRSFGTIDADEIVGKLTIRIFPVNKFKSYL